MSSIACTQVRVSGPCLYPPGFGAPAVLPLHFTPVPAMLPSMEKGGHLDGQHVSPRLSVCRMSVADFGDISFSMGALGAFWPMIHGPSDSHFPYRFCYPLAGVSSAISNRHFGPSFPDDVFGGADRYPRSPRSPRSPHLKLPLLPT